VFVRIFLSLYKSFDNPMNLSGTPSYASHYNFMSLLNFPFGKAVNRVKALYKESKPN
jgi:hypothetical protein